MTVQYAGFEKRLIAAFIDWIILSFISLPINLIFSSIILSSSTYQQDNLLNLKLDFNYSIENILYILAMMVVHWLYFAQLESSKNQGSIGKQAMDIIVTDTNGNRLSFQQATLRFLGKYLFGFIYFDDQLFFLIWINSHIRPIYTREKQTLHDVLAGTLVVNK